MNVEQLRQSLKIKWLSYYRDNRAWLNRLGVWVTCEGQRRPSSSFILATLSVLEPQLTALFPLIVSLSNHPDRVVAALGLNFNPEEELKHLESRRAAMIAEKAGTNTTDSSVRMLPSGTATPIPSMKPEHQETTVSVERNDESCRGSYSQKI